MPMQIAVAPYEAAAPTIPDPMRDWAKLASVQSIEPTLTTLTRICREQIGQDSIAGAIAAVNLAAIQLEQSHDLYGTAGQDDRPQAGTPKARAAMAMSAISALEDADRRIAAVQQEAQTYSDRQAGSYTVSEVRKIDRHIEWHQDCYRCLTAAEIMKWHIERSRTALLDDNAVLAEAHAINMDHLAIAIQQVANGLEQPPGAPGADLLDRQRALLNHARQAVHDCQQHYIAARFGHRKTMPFSTDPEVQEFLETAPADDAARITAAIREDYAHHHGHIMVQSVTENDLPAIDLITVEHNGAIHTFAGGNPFPFDYPAQTVIDDLVQYDSVGCPHEDEDCDTCAQLDEYGGDASRVAPLLMAYIQAAEAGIHDCPAATLRAIFRQGDLATGGNRYARRMLLGALSHGECELAIYLTDLVWPEGELDLEPMFTKQDAKRILDFAQNQLRLSRHAVHTLAIAMEADEDRRIYPPLGKRKPGQQALRLLRKAGASEDTLVNAASALGQPSVNLGYKTVIIGE